MSNLLAGRARMIFPRNSIALLAVIFGVGSATAQDCVQECDARSALCLVVPSLVAGPDIPWALKHLHAFARKSYPAFTMRPDTLLGFFRMTATQDPCGRGDTVVGQARIRNTGASACQITLGVPTLPGTKDVSIGFDVPLTVDAQIRLEAGTFEVDFTGIALDNVPVFWINDTLLNPDWGGRMQRFYFSSSQVTLATSSGCIRYEY